MSDYLFELIKHGRTETPDKSHLENRPFVNFRNTFEEEAPLYYPGEQLELAINTAIAVGEPLLITGEPGTGKTQAAYYVAHKLGLKLIRFQVKSDTTAGDLLYHFDAVRYFYEANVRRDAEPLPDKGEFIEKRPLYLALEAEEPCVLLIDEIDKAPRDFPNDLLHEIDKLEFTVTETGRIVSAPPAKRPLVFITSNNERRLPEPFLRRCVYHNIRFSEEIVENAVKARQQEFTRLNDEFVKLALKQFLALRSRGDLRKKPSTGECLTWLRILSLATNLKIESLQDEDLSKLPYLGVLIKDSQDFDAITKTR